LTNYNFLNALLTLHFLLKTVVSNKLLRRRAKSQHCRTPPERVLLQEEGDISPEGMSSQTKCSRLEL